MVYTEDFSMHHYVRFRKSGHIYSSIAYTHTIDSYS